MSELHFCVGASWLFRGMIGQAHDYPCTRTTRSRRPQNGVTSPSRNTASVRCVCTVFTSISGKLESKRHVTARAYDVQRDSIFSGGCPGISLQTKTLAIRSQLSEEDYQSSGEECRFVDRSERECVSARARDPRPRNALKTATSAAEEVEWTNDEIGEKIRWQVAYRRAVRHVHDYG